MNIFTLIAPSSSSSTPVGYRILPKQTPTILMVCVCVLERESELKHLLAFQVLTVFTAPHL